MSKSAPSFLRLIPRLKRHTPKWVVYFLCSGDEVVYVGQSANLTGRLEGHRDKSFDQTYYIAV